MSNAHRTNPLVLAIFGITGDLAQRKLLPALYRLVEAGELTDDFKIIGISRREVALADVYAQLDQFMGTDSLDQAVLDKLIAATEMRQMDLLATTDYESLLIRLREIESTLGDSVNRVYYLSIPSQAFLPIIKRLGETGHAAQLADGALPRLLIEKPFGYDLASAHELMSILNQHFTEDQIYRIDHYIAKQSVQDMLAFRSQNDELGSVWNAQHIDEISIIAFETIGIEGRADFYEQTGALRDLIQGHLLQLLAITAMPRPRVLTSDAIHEAKLHLLRCVKPIAPDHVHDEALRGQYEGYRAEVANPDSNTETYARLTLHIDSPEWQGVPVVLETGKALAEKRTEVRIHFRHAQTGTDTDNTLIFHIQSPTPQTSSGLQPSHGATSPTDAYERIILDATQGDQTLFASAAEVIRSWEIVANVLEQWSHGAEGLVIYPRNSVIPITHS